MNEPSGDDRHVYQHPACSPAAALLPDCDIRRLRTGGPGGQRRNKVETAVEITHVPTGLTAAASERRSQEENRNVAIRRLRLVLAVEHRAVSSAHVEPSALWQSRCGGGRISCNDRHPDFPSLLAEALDAVYAKEADVRKAAAALGCSSSQLIRFIAKTPEALERVNALRTDQGLRRLHR